MKYYCNIDVIKTPHMFSISSPSGSHIFSGNPRGRVRAVAAAINIRNPFVQCYFKSCPEKSFTNNKVFCKPICASLENQQDYNFFRSQTILCLVVKEKTRKYSRGADVSSYHSSSPMRSFMSPTHAHVRCVQLTNVLATTSLPARGLPRGLP